MKGNLKLIALVCALVVIVAVYYFFFSQEVVAPVSDIPVELVETQDPIQTTPQSITIQHSFTKGTHTVRGTIVLPTPCYTLGTEVEMSSSTPSVATIFFSSGDPGGMCIQVIDERPFEVTFKAADSTAVRGVLNGTAITLTESTE